MMLLPAPTFHVSLIIGLSASVDVYQLGTWQLANGTEPCLYVPNKTRTHIATMKQMDGSSSPWI